MKRLQNSAFFEDRTFSTMAIMTIRSCLSSVLLLASSSLVNGCTDILVTPGASEDGSAMIAYNADSPVLFGYIAHYEASAGKGGTMRKVYDWDSGVYLGVSNTILEMIQLFVSIVIPWLTENLSSHLLCTHTGRQEIAEANETFNVVGNSNEHGLVIGESTFGGVPALAWNQTGSIIDYGSLIYITLMRAKTAREAIQIMSDLMDTYGYHSGGESFSLADRSGEVWMMEVIGRGSDYGKLGAVWVAQRIPDGYVTAHANQARITTFDRNDPENCLYAEDVIDVAVHYGLYSDSADPGDFSFSDVFNPVHFLSARQSEARVWSIFSHIADADGTFERTWEKYATGESTKERMPLYIQTYKKLSAKDVMHLMASHYEGTALDSSRDVGAGLFESPYRPRPLVWSYENHHNETTLYHNERSIATAKTGWSFVAQIRPWMPRELSALSWFACDDSSTSPRVPVYGSSRSISSAYSGKGAQDGVTTPLLKLDLTKAFWVQNMVSNLAYFRYRDIYPVLRAKIDSVQDEMTAKVFISDKRALDLYQKEGAEKAVDYATLVSINAGNALHSAWMNFYGELFVRFRDFYSIVPKEDEPVCGCEAREPGLSDVMKRRIIQETGQHYEVGSDAQEQAKATLSGESDYEASVSRR